MEDYLIHVLFSKKTCVYLCTFVTSHDCCKTSIHYYLVLQCVGFNEEFGRVLLAHWLDIDPSSLSPHADTILKYCRGSPMAIGLIGAILRKGVNNEGRWKAIAEKLEKKHYHLHVPTHDWNYPTLKASIEVR